MLKYYKYVFKIWFKYWIYILNVKLIFIIIKVVNLIFDWNKNYWFFIINK